MRRATVCKTAASIALLAAPLAWAQISLEPGQYELTTEVRVPGSGQTMKTTAIDCLSDAEARDFQGLMIRKSEEASCQVSNLTKTAADKITFDTNCAGSGTTAHVRAYVRSRLVHRCRKGPDKRYVEHIDGQRETDLLHVHRRGMS